MTLYNLNVTVITSSHAWPCLRPCGFPLFVLALCFSGTLTWHTCPCMNVNLNPATHRSLKSLWKNIYSPWIDYWEQWRRLGFCGRLFIFTVVCLSVWPSLPNCKTSTLQSNNCHPVSLSSAQPPVWTPAESEQAVMMASSSLSLLFLLFCQLFP